MSYWVFGTPKQTTQQLCRPAIQTSRHPAMTDKAIGEHQLFTFILENAQLHYCLRCVTILLYANAEVSTANTCQCLVTYSTEDIPPRPSRLSVWIITALASGTAVSAKGLLWQRLPLTPQHWLLQLQRLTLYSSTQLSTVEKSQ